ASFGACDVDPTVPPLALLIRKDRLEQVAAAEVGPERLGDVDLGVGDLPEQVVADAHLAARPNQQIWIRLPRGVEEARELLLVEIVRADARLNRAAGRIQFSIENA